MHAYMNAANLENPSSESNVKGRVGGGKWARTKVERRWEMAMTLCCGPAVTDKAACEAPLPRCFRGVIFWVFLCIDVFLM